MDAREYLEGVERGLSRRPGVVSVEGLFLRIASTTRVAFKFRVIFFDQSYLDLREYINTDTHVRGPVIEYAYYYSRDGRKIFGYDNAPHHPGIETYPYHKHTWTPEGREEITASPKPSYNQLFAEIESYFVFTTGHFLVQARMNLG